MLHIIRQVYLSADFEACLAQINDDDQLVLIEDAVYAWVSKDPRLLALHSEQRLHILQADVEARAIEVPNDVQIDYRELVKLTVNYAPAVTW